MKLPRYFGCRRKDKRIMHKQFKRHLIAGLMLLAVPFFVNSPCHAADVPVGISVEQAAKGGVNWMKGANSYIEAVGVGLLGENGPSLAHRAAVMDAQRNLLEIIKGVSVNSESTMEDLYVTSDIVKTKVEGVLKGAQIVEEGQNLDGSYYVKMRVPLYGSTSSLASAAFSAIRPETETPVPPPAVTEPMISPEEIQTVQSAAYTGVVVDASLLGLEPTFSPIIYDTNGRAVYGIDNIETSVVINSGMVGYANAVEEAASGSRAGNNPLVVKAVEVRGGNNSSNPVNVVVSVEDADRIITANATNNFLMNGAVMFVK